MNADAYRYAAFASSIAGSDFTQPSASRSSFACSFVSHPDAEGMMDFHRDDIYCTAYTTRPKISFHQAPPTPDSNIQKFQGSHRAVTMRSHRMDEGVVG